VRERESGGTSPPLLLYQPVHPESTRAAVR
jgi:hypothetical protein